MSKLKSGKKQLARLEMLTDMVFAITIWRLFLLLPRPEGENLRLHSVRELFHDNGHLFAIVTLGIVVVIVYWIQHNSLFAFLQRTDTIHTVLSIFQVCFVLFMLYAISLSVSYEGDQGTRILESLAALLLGSCSFAGWRYAMTKGDLLSAEISSEEAQAISTRIMAEPITAAITIPCAFIGPLFWDLSWFFYPLLAYLLRVRQYWK